MVVAATILLTGVLAFDPSFVADPAPDAVMGDGLRLVGPSEPQAAKVCAAGEELRGIDVSKWQGDIDWGKVAADGISYAFVRVSDGVNTFDSRFDDNWEEARAAGIHTGVYQFFRPNQSAIAQADLLIEHMGELQPGDLPPVIDVEATGGLSPSGVAAKVAQWIDRVESATGVRPIIYTGRYFWRDQVGDDQYGEDYDLWIAHYTSGCPNLPPQWDDWTFHQFSDKGKVAGITGNVDVNDFNGSLEDLLQHTVEPGSIVGCEPVPAEGATIDNDDPCHDLHGPPQYWRSAADGQGGDLSWTKSTKSKVFNYATWKLAFDTEGDYLLEAFIDPDFGETHSAHYEVLHDGVEDVVVVDQGAANGWTVVGTFGFAAGGDQLVTLTDKTGETSKVITFDALRLTPAGGPQSVHDGDPTALPPLHVDRDDALGCSVSSQAPPTWCWVLLLCGAHLRRRRFA